MFPGRPALQKVEAMVQSLTSSMEDKKGKWIMDESEKVPKVEKR